MPAQLLFDSSGTKPTLSRAPVVAPRPETFCPGATTSSPAPSAGVGTKIARRSVEPRGLHDNPSAETYAVGDSSLRIISLHCCVFRCAQHSTACTHPANVHYIRLSIRRASDRLATGGPGNGPWGFRRGGGAG